MKKHYVVIKTNGYTECANKKAAIEALKDNDAMYCIYTTSQNGNYYHNRIKAIVL